MATIINMRAPGMTYMRLPLFTWTTFVASALILFAFPPLTVGLALMMLDRLFGTNFFNPELGGNTVIWEHLFWIFGHPEVYILILPAFGIFFPRSSLFSPESVCLAILQWFCHRAHWLSGLYGMGAPHVHNWSWPDCKCDFAVATMAIAIPTGIKIFNWLLTIWGEM
ncbi:cbb3-type cytochrome c oxidase subunit I [Bacillus stercoris]|nr:cbb3-type cytochrome c oxidase subunit I [Bacillus stercoris]